MALHEEAMTKERQKRKLKEANLRQDIDKEGKI